MLVAWPAPWLVLSCVGAKSSSPGGLRDAPVALLESGCTQGRAGCAMECSHPQARLLKSLFHHWITLVAPQSFPWRLPVVACSQKSCNRDIFFPLSFSADVSCMKTMSLSATISWLDVLLAHVSFSADINAGTFPNMYL